MSELSAPPIFDALDGVLDPRAHDHAIGHSAAHGQISRAFAQNRAPQAWLLQGQTGVGKASFAWHYARRLAKNGRIDDYVPDADELTRHARSEHFSIYALSPPFDEKTGFKSQTPIETIRNLTERLRVAPTDGGWRVVIIDPADALTTQAANALLKLLEEPPARVVFFLISSMPDRLLPTIKSRCQTLRFAPLSTAEITKIWPLVTRRELPAASQLVLAEGSVRTALLLDERYVADYQAIVQTLAGHASTADLLAQANRMSNDKGLGNRTEILDRAGKLFQLAAGRVLRMGTGAFDAQSPFATFEQQAAEKIIGRPHQLAEVATATQRNFHEAAALNLDAETAIFQALRAIDQLAKAQ